VIRLELDRQLLELGLRLRRLALAQLERLFDVVRDRRETAL